MFKLFNKFRTETTPLLTSKLYDEHSFYSAFSYDMRYAKSTILIESPYITVRRATEITPLLKRAKRRGVSILIYTRNPLHHDGILISEASRGIAILRQAGAEIVTCEDMRHRKLAIIDDQILWEGSLNMLSQNGSKEVMRRIKSQELCCQMLQFIEVNKKLR